MSANEDFFEYVGLTPQRWAQLQKKLKGLARTEKTPAQIMRVMMEDTSVGSREQVILAFYLGFSQGETKPRTRDIRILKAGLN